MNSMFFNLSHSVIYDLVRIKSNNGWIYGKIFKNSEFVCHSLEVLREDNLQHDMYELFPTIDEISGKRVIEVKTGSGFILSEFVHENTEYWQGIEIRKDDNKITCGCMVMLPNLINREYFYERIYKELFSNRLSGFTSVLRISGNL